MRGLLVPLALLVAGCATAAPPERDRDPQSGSRASRGAASPDAPRLAALARGDRGDHPYGTVDLDEHDTPLAQVIDKIAAAAERPILAQVSSTTLVTLTLHAAPWRDALDYLVHAHHLVRRDQGRVILVEEPPHNRLDASGAAPGTWFLLLARAGGFSIIIPGNLKGSIDASLSNVRYEDVLRATAREQGLEVEPVK